MPLWVLWVKLTALRPDLVYANGKFTEAAVTIDDGGRIVDVGASEGATRLEGVALMPGMVNAHSHAFQRAIRGWTQWKPLGEDADFWSWRDAMYKAVLRMTPAEIYAISRFCFIEMLLAGYTTVGEFHYLQCDESGGPYADPNTLPNEVIRAALSAGMRIALLNVCYARGDVGQPLKPEQRRFNTPDLDAFLRQTDQLAAQHQGSDRVSVGIAPHSVRAVPREWLRQFGEYATERGMPVHMHVSEQPAEVAASQRAYGLRPGEVVAEAGLLNERFAAIHGTHLVETEIETFGAAHASICACPTTERDLGDGILSAREFLDHGGRICIGTDSQTVIDPWEEIRSVEYHTRLAKLRRVVLARETAGRLQITQPLLEMGSVNGAHALRVASGSIEAGRAADFIAIDLEHPALAGWTPETLPSLIALSAPAQIVRDVWVNGRQVVRNRQHESMLIAKDDFVRACRRVLA